MDLLRYAGVERHGCAAAGRKSFPRAGELEARASVARVVGLHAQNRGCPWPTLTATPRCQSRDTTMVSRRAKHRQRMLSQGRTKAAEITRFADLIVGRWAQVPGRVLCPELGCRWNCGRNDRHCRR